MGDEPGRPAGFAGRPRGLSGRIKSHRHSQVRELAGAKKVLASLPAGPPGPTLWTNPFSETTPEEILHDLRNAHLSVDRRRRWTSSRRIFQKSIEKRNEVSPIMGFFHTEVGDLNRVRHIWRYEEHGPPRRGACEDDVDGLVAAAQRAPHSRTGKHGFDGPPVSA